MKNSKGPLTKYKKLMLSAVALLTSLLLILLPIGNLNVKAESDNIIRVGSFESSYNQISDAGYRSGYAYDYLQTISAYTGWKYEYVSGTWTELMTMLENGEIDIISDVSFTNERLDKMLFSSLPLGEERSYIFTNSELTHINADNLADLDGKKVGISGYSVERDYFLSFCKCYNIEAEIIEYSGDPDLAQAFLKGEIDAFVATDAFNSLDNVEPIMLIGISDIYFAININRPDLKNQLDNAMNSLEQDNPYLKNELTQKYITHSVSKYLSTDSLNYLHNVGSIKIGYLDNFLPFCDKDDETGELTGALSSYLYLISNCFSNAKINFEPIAYSSTKEAFAALKQGKIDCMFPCNLNLALAEQEDLVITGPICQSDIFAIVNNSSIKFEDTNSIAMNSSNTLYSELVNLISPGTTVKEYPDTESSFKSVASGEADCVLVSNYRLNNLDQLLDNYNLYPLSTGKIINHGFAINQNNLPLYSILSRAIVLIPGTNINSLLSYYSVRIEKTTLSDTLKENYIVVVIFALATISLLIIQLISNNSQRKKLQITLKNYEQADLDRRTDFLTGLKNRQDMFDMLQKSMEDGAPIIEAMFMMDIDNFKSFNDHYGHVKGDECLRTIALALKEYGSTRNVQFFRYGGEEILGVSFEGAPEASKISDDIINLVRDLNIPRDDVDLCRVSISLGYTTKNKRYEKMIDMADEAMYYAKRHGKNKSVRFEELPSSK